MSKQNKIIRGIILGTAMVVIGLAVLLPALVNTDSIKVKILRAASQAIEGQVDYKQIRLALLPRPHAVISQGRIAIPNFVQGKWVELSVFPRLSALIVGRFEVADLVLKQPDFELKLPLLSRHKSKKPAPFQRSDDFRQQVEEGFGSIAAMVKDVEVEIEDGRLSVLDKDKTPLEWQDAHQVNIGVVLLKGHFRFSPSQLSLQFDRLDLDNPQLSLIGELLVNPSKATGIQLRATGQNVDVNAVRATVRSLGGHITDVMEVFDIVKGGQVPTIKVEIQGKDWADLSEFKRWRIEGEMIDGIIFIPKLNLDFTDVNAYAIIENGILTVENIQAKYGPTQGEMGTLKFDIGGNSKLFQLDIDLAANLAQLPAVLNRVIDDVAFKAELARIEQITGAATGKLILGDNLNDISVQIDVSEFDLKARYNRLPHPLVVKGGRFQLKGNEIRAGDLRAQMQNTYFSKISGRVNWSHTTEFEVQTGAGTIALSEIYPWLKDHADLAESMKTIEAVNGLIAVSSLDLKGPFSLPSAWRFNISGDIQNLVVKTTRLPKTLLLPQGQFKLVPESLILSQSRTQLLDLETDFSAKVTDYMKGVNELSFSGSGKIGPDFVRWFTHEIKLPAEYQLIPPIDFNNLDVDWNRSGEIAVAGSMTTLNGTIITADIRFAPDEIDIRKLTIYDDASDAEFVLNHKSKAMVTNLSFKGNLAKASLDQFWKKNQFLEGSVKGNLQVQIDRKQPLNSLINGNIEAQQVFLPLKEVGPMRIDHAVLSAFENKLKVDDADLDWLGNSFRLNGYLVSKPDSVFFEINATAEDIDVAKFEILFKEKEQKSKTAAKKTPRRLQGVINIDAQRLKYGFYTWTPYRATLLLEKDSMTMKINEASLCGIATLGTVKILPHGIWLEIIPSSQPERIKYALGCLLGKPATERMEGQFRVAGAVNAEGKTADELLRNLKGDLEITIQDGRIYNVGTVGAFTNMFAFLNVNRLVKGDVPDLNNNDFRFKSLSSKFNIQDGKFILTEGYVDAESLNIVATEGEFNMLNQTLDLTLLVSPLTTVDTIVKYTPIVGQILQGTLIAIPVKVDGDISNPEVSALSPSAYGSRAMDIIKRTLKMPVKIIEPILLESSNPQKIDRQEP